MKVLSKCENRSEVITKNCYVKKIRSNCPKMFCKIDALKIFAEFTGKHLCWSLILLTLQAIG